VYVCFHASKGEQEEQETRTTKRQSSDFIFPISCHERPFVGNSKRLVHFLIILRERGGGGGLDRGKKSLERPPRSSFNPSLPRHKETREENRRRKERRDMIKQTDRKIPNIPISLRKNASFLFPPCAIDNNNNNKKSSFLSRVLCKGIQTADIRPKAKRKCQGIREGSVKQCPKNAIAAKH
jgi:hypothetical protein